jgi:flavin reductase (DIM6/NTAB) family NADH-FMN oxidoreductase RutF
MSRASNLSVGRYGGRPPVVTVRRVSSGGEEQRELFRRWPAGVSVVVAETGGRKAGLTVSSLVSVSLEPPLVSISLGRGASIFEVLDEAGRWGASILAADQAHLAQHFSRSVPPLVQWDGIPARADEPLLLAGAVGWILADIVERVEVGDHVIFVGAVRSLEAGPGQGALVYFDRRYVAL